MAATDTTLRGTRATSKYVRMSATKARQVLDLVRGKTISEADEILAFTQRGAAPVIRKTLDSAVANAEHNDEIPAEDLYVSACWADEGPTLKRWRPRARGRATRIRKRTCHITMVVSRLPEDELERIRAVGRAASRATADADARRRRVARSRAAEAAASEEEGESPDSPDSSESPESVDSSESPESVDSSESPDSVDSPDATDTDERADSADTPDEATASDDVASDEDDDEGKDD